jgi:hypothetical protein
MSANDKTSGPAWRIKGESSQRALSLSSGKDPRDGSAAMHHQGRFKSQGKRFASAAIKPRT